MRTYSIRKNLRNYDLEGTRLSIWQSLNAKQEIDLSQIKASILEDVLQRLYLMENARTNTGV